MENTTSVIINKRKFAFYFSVGIVAIIFILASFLAMMGDHRTFADVPGLMLAIVAIISYQGRHYPHTSTPLPPRIFFEDTWCRRQGYGAIYLWKARTEFCVDANRHLVIPRNQ